MSRLTNKMTMMNRRNCSDYWANKTQTAYFNWLCHLVQVDDHYGSSYFVMAKILHNIEFYSIVPRDDNREKDGTRLREIWLDEIIEVGEELGCGYPDYSLKYLSGPCTMLEMLVGLSYRIEMDVMQDDREGNRTSFWFWQMILNLTLGMIDNLSDDYITPDGENILKEDVARVLDRKYEYDGRYGLFPLRESTLDMREVELWYQAQFWLQENGY